MAITIIISLVILILLVIILIPSENDGPAEVSRRPIISKISFNLNTERNEQAGRVGKDNNALNPNHDEKWQHWIIGAIVHSGSIKVRVIERFTDPQLHFWVKSVVNDSPLTVFPHHGHHSGHIHQPPSGTR